MLKYKFVDKFQLVAVQLHTGSKHILGSFVDSPSSVEMSACLEEFLDRYAYRKYSDYELSVVVKYETLVNC